MVLLLLPAFSHAATIYWKTSSTLSWTSSSWSTVVGGPYTSAYTSGADVVFEANGGTTLTITGATTNFASITANENVTVTPGGTLGTGGAVATIDVASGKTLTFAGQTIDTTAGFIKNGLGTWSLTGSAYTGGLTLNAGTILAGGTSALGAGALTINSGKIASTNTTGRDFSGKFTAITIGGDFALGDATNTGALTFNATTTLGTSVRTITVNSAVVWAGAISGTGAGITKQGTGSLTLSGANTYTGATTITAGTLQIGSGGTSGSLSTSSTITNNGTLAFNRSDTLTQGTNFAAGITGTGGVTQSGSGVTVLSGTNSYTGTTTVSAGLLRLDSTGALPGGIGTTGGTSALLFNGGVIGLTSDFTRPIGNTTPTSAQVGWASGATGGFAAFGGDRIVNFGGASATVTWSSTGGVLGGGLILSHSTSDSTVTVVNPIAFNAGTRTIIVNDGSAAVDAILSGAMTGTGSFLIKTGAGTLALTGANTLGSALTAGTTFITISAGTLQLGNGGTAGSLTSGGTGDIQDDSIFAIKSSNNITLQYIIKGSGAVNQIGTGITTLTGGNNYTGGTNVNSGTLTFLNVSAMPGTGTTTVASGATLGLGISASGGFSATDVDSLFAGTLANVTNSATSNVGIDTAAGDFVYSSSVPVTTRGLTKLGVNTLTLTGANAYTGPTTISVGTLQLGNGGTTGSLDGTSSIVNNGTLAFNRSDASLIIGTVISGTGAVTQLGTGTTILAAANTYTGATTINSGGTLQLGSGGTAGSIGSTASITNNGTLAFNRSDSGLIISVGISGAGAVTQMGSGTTILSATNSYSGQTTINAGGTLQLGNGGTAGNLSNSAVLNNGTLVFNRSTTGVSFTPVISGSGDVKFIGTGSIVFSSAHTYTGQTTINAGSTLQLGSGGAAGSILNTSGVLDNGTLVFNRSGTPTAIGFVISGSGVVNLTGTGTITLAAANTYTGATTISSGTLQLGFGTGGGAAGSIAGTSSIVNNSILSFNRSNLLSVTTNISGSGVVNQIGSGITSLSGTNSYAGGTNVNSGGLTFLNTNARPASGTTTVAAGAVLGLGVAASGSFYTTTDVNNLFAGAFSGVTLDATSIVGIDTTAGDFTYSSSISATTRGLAKLGSNTLTLTGTNAYTGSTLIYGGALDVGTMSGSSLGAGGIQFANDGVLQGNGTFTRNFSGSATAGAGQIAGLSGGFAARGGTLTVNFGGAGATLVISNGSVRFGGNFVFGSSTADSKVVVVNPLNLNDLSRTFTVNSGVGGDSAELQGIISSSTVTDGIVKAGTGLLILSATNSYTGSTVINAGTLQLGSGTGGSSAGSINSTSGVINNGVLAYNRSGSISPGYSISGTGVVNQIGAGTTSLSGVNTYSGGTNVTAGGLTFMNTGAKPASGITTVAAGATLGLGVGTSGGLFTSSDVDNLFAGTLTNVTNSTASIVGIDTTAGDFTYATNVSATTRGLNKLGAGTLSITGANSYTGTTIASNGVLRIDSANALPGGVGATGGTSALLFNGGVIGLTAASGDFTRSIGGASPTSAQVGWASSGTGGFAAFGGNRQVNFGGSNTPTSLTWSSAGGVFGGGLILSDSTSDSTITVVNPINLSNSSSSRTITVNDGSAAVDAVMAGVLSSQITSGNGTRLVKNGSGTLALTAANTYVSGNTNAGTTISAGTLQLGNGGSTGSLSYVATTTGFNSDVSVASGATFAFNRTDNGLVVANVITGAGAVNQLGTGTTTLSGDNTYTGGTTVTRGTLLITNSIDSGTGTGSVSVAVGATLGGTGTIAPDSSNSVVIGGTLAPGVAGVGTLTFTPVDGNLTLQSGSSVVFQLSANHTNDKLVFSATGTGTLDLSAMSPGSMSVTFAGGYTPALNDSFDLLDWTSVIGLSDSLLNLSTAGFDPSWSWDTSQFTTSGMITVIGVVPEPSRLLFLACGLISIVLRRRRAH